MTGKKIYMVRHGQSEVNVTMDPTIPDPSLTKLGRDQGETLRQATEGTFQKSAQLLLTSPLKRSLETTVIAFPCLVERLGKEEGNKAIVLDILQESGSEPANTPTAPVETLKESQGGIYSHLNYTLLSPDYAKKTGIFEASTGKVKERAKMVRKFLRERDEDEIVVVSHGDIMHWIVDRKHQETVWDNGQVRVFEFGPGKDDPDLVEITQKSTSGPTIPILSDSGPGPALTVNQISGKPLPTPKD